MKCPKCKALNVDQAATKCHACSAALPPVRVEALVRNRYGVKKGMGQFWVHDRTDNRFMALCPRGHDARAIVKSLNGSKIPNPVVRGATESRTSPPRCSAS